MQKDAVVKASIERENLARLEAERARLGVARG